MRYGVCEGFITNSQDYGAARLDALNCPCRTDISARRHRASRQAAARSFEKLMRRCCPAMGRRGDERWDRLARSSRDLHNVLHELPERSCGFVSAWRDMVRHDHRRGRLVDDDSWRHR